MKMLIVFFMFTFIAVFPVIGSKVYTLPDGSTTETFYVDDKGNVSSYNYYVSGVYDHYVKNNDNQYAWSGIIIDHLNYIEKKIDAKQNISNNKELTSIYYAIIDLRDRLNTIEQYTKINFKKRESDAIEDKVSCDSKDASNVWEFAVGGNLTGHPAVFPEQLANDHIISWSNKGDVVYDCFGGSGTTGVMAMVNDRKFILSEVSCEYCDLMRDRFKDRFGLNVEIVG